MTDAKKQKIINFSILKARIVWFFSRIKWIIWLVILSALSVIFNKYFFDNANIDHQLILQYLYAFKIVIAIIVGAFILRRFFPELVDRAQELGPGGAKFYPKQQQFNKDEEEQLEKATKKRWRWH